MTTDSQRRAQASYDKKRPKSILIRLLKGELKALDEQRQQGESRPAAIKRLILGDNDA